MANERKVKEKGKKNARVLLVDDHPMVRERLAEIIQREKGLSVCGEAEDRWQALDLIEKTAPDIAILDITLKNSNGIDLIKDIKVRWPKLRMLVVSMHDESLHAERAVRAGASGYITKQEATKKILVALRTVQQGGVYFSEKMAREIAAKATRALGNRGGMDLDKLSDRELQVFELIGQIRSTRDIAAQLNVSVRTVETYRARIKDKLQLDSANELLQRATFWVQTGKPV